MKKIGEWRLLVGTLCLLAGWLSGHAEVADSVQTKDLNELVVTAKRGWIEDDKIVYIPTKTEQKLSNSPETLIEAMHLPMLIVTGGSITTISGEPVNIFINGNPANTTDLATFWPKQAKRVEFLRNPSDAKFRGAQNVVNFIMQEYEVGGVTKVEATGQIPNQEIGSISSKLVYKNLQLGLRAFIDNDVRNRDYSENFATYRNLYYNGNFYDKITLAQEKHIKNKYLDDNVTLNANLTLPKGRLEQALTWGWGKVNSSSHGEGLWDPILFDSETQWSANSRRSNLISYTGGYFHKFNAKWYLSGVFSYAHAHVDNNSSFQTSDLPRVDNTAEESSNAFSINLKPTWYVSKAITLQLNCANNTTLYKTNYGGSANELVRQTRNETNIELTFWWRPINSITLTAYPAINILHSKISSDRITYVSPAGNVALFWTPSRKFSMYGFAYFERNNPPVSSTAPVTIRTSELLWTEGNPFLKPQESFNFYISPTYIPFDWFSMGGFVGIFKTYHPQGYSYESAPEQMEGLIVKTVSFPSSERYNAEVNFNLSLFKRKLNISARPSFTHWFARSDGRKRVNDFRYHVSADYTLGNCRASLAYHSPSKGLFANGNSFRNKDNLDFTFTWGTGNLYLSIQCLNILRNKTYSISNTDSDAYSEHNVQYTTGRTLRISASYTFGYGKKVDSNISIMEGTSIDSSILNTK